MGIYDPEFEPKPFVPFWRDGEIPGSKVLGKTRNLGCVWPGRDGKWFAALPDHDSSTQFPYFLSVDSAMEYIVDPIRRAHIEKERDRRMQWECAEPKRIARAERSKEREAKRKHKKNEIVWVVRAKDGTSIGRIVRETQAQAEVGAASLLGFCKLPDGHYVEKLEKVELDAKE